MTQQWCSRELSNTIYSVPEVSQQRDRMFLKPQPPHSSLSTQRDTVVFSHGLFSRDARRFNRGWYNSIEVQWVYYWQLFCRGKSIDKSFAFLHLHFFLTVKGREGWESIALWKSVSSVWEAGGSIPQNHEENLSWLIKCKGYTGARRGSSALMAVSFWWCCGAATAIPPPMIQSAWWAHQQKAL